MPPTRNVGLDSSARHVGLRVVEVERAVRGVVVAVLAGGLRREPLADVARVAAGALGECLRRRRSELGERPVEPELVAEHDGRRVQDRGEVAEEPPGELLDGRCRVRCRVGCSWSCHPPSPGCRRLSIAGWRRTFRRSATDLQNPFGARRCALQEFCRVRRRGEGMSATQHHHHRPRRHGTTDDRQSDDRHRGRRSLPRRDRVRPRRRARRRLRRRRRSRRHRAELAVLGDAARPRSAPSTRAGSRTPAGSRSQTGASTSTAPSSPTCWPGTRTACRTPATTATCSPSTRSSTAAASSPTRCGVAAAGRRPCSPRWRRPSHDG